MLQSRKDIYENLHLSEALSPSTIWLIGIGGEQGWTGPPGHRENSRWAARTSDIIIINLEKNVLFAAFLYYINTVSMGKHTNISLVHINSYSLSRLPKQLVRDLSLN